MRLLASVHRWLGIFLCLFFAMWFASGIVMVYIPFPSLSEQGRLQYLSIIDTNQIRIAPIQALIHCQQDLTALRLITVNERPAYVCHAGSSSAVAVYADDGSPVDINIVNNSGMTSFDYDQWVVHQRFDPYRPFYRTDLTDNYGTQIYTSTRTGEVLQRTEHNQRLWNYVGAVIHWIYPTFLRKHWALWDQTVWWLSLAGMVGVLIGIYLGISALIKLRHIRHVGISPFTGWMRWHHTLGLFVGIIVLTWIFSGWLSMDHGRLFSTPDPGREQINAFRGMDYQEIAESYSTSELMKITAAKEISFHAVAGQSLLLVKNDNRSTSLQLLSQDVIRTGVSKAWPEIKILTITPVADNDIYTSLREGSLPEETIRIVLDDPGKTWIHVNLINGEILSIMDRSRRMYRWLYNGLHSLDFPGLVDQRPLWDIVMIFLLITGLTFSLTGIIIAFKYFSR